MNPTFVQPSDEQVTKLGIEPTRPADVDCAKGLGLEVNAQAEAEEDHEETRGGVEKGVRVGWHWFEVMPVNKVQSELIELSNK